MKQFTRVHGAVIGLALAIAVAGSGIAGARAPAGKVPPSPADTQATEASITRLTSTLLAQSQFTNRPQGADFGGKLLSRYLDALDGGRSLFLQTDVAEFDRYRETLAEATRERGDTAAAHAIFARYLERLSQLVHYTDETLGRATFDFTGKDVYTFDREKARRPANLAAARELWLVQLRAQYLQEKLADKRSAREIVATLKRRQNQRLGLMKALTRAEVLEIYLSSLAQVYDPHSDYLSHEQMASLSIAMNLSLFGIGASLESDEGYCKIRELIPGGPAAKSGKLKPGDRIVAVAQAAKEPVDIVNMPLSRAVELIRGPKGTRVTLSVIPADEPDASTRKTVVLVRDEINLEDQRAKAEIIDMPGSDGKPVRLGVLELPSFYAAFNGAKGSAQSSATADVSRLLDKLKAEKVRGIVLDLRRNGGGSLEEAVSLTGLFIRKGPVVQTRGPLGDVDVEADPDPAVVYEGPLVLLTSRFSASASEILAGALKDYGRALVAGDSSTFGKGTVQSVLSLAPIMDKNSIEHAYDPGALKVTIRKFYRPAGASMQLHGVAADIVLPSPSDVAEISESALKDPLPWDQVPAAKYQPVNLVQPHLATLQSLSTKRVAGSGSFGLLARDIARTRETLATKSVSLNESERKRELAESKRRKAQWERENEAFEASRPPSYTITVKNASLPGLPERSKPAARKPSASSDDSDRLAPGDSPADKLVAREAQEILADYVRLHEKTAAAPIEKRRGAAN